MMGQKKHIVTTVVWIFLAATIAFAQSSPTFNLEQNVVAGGGQRSSSPSFTLEGTIGQPVAGNRSMSSSFLLRDGFWALDSLAPTSANVVVSGRVMLTRSHSISRAFVTITDPISNLHFQTFTGPLGYFTFTEIPVGKTYVISVSHGRHVFDPPSQIVNVQDNISDIVFYAAQ